MTQLLKAVGRLTNLVSEGNRGGDLTVEMKDSQEGWLAGHDEKINMHIPAKMMRHLREKMIKISGRDIHCHEDHIKVKLIFKLK